MNTLHAALDAELAKQPIRVAADMLEAKLNERGVKLSKRQRAKLEAALRRDADDPVALRAGRPWQRGSIALEVTEHDLAVVHTKTDTWLEEVVPRVLEESSAQTASALLSVLRNRWAKQSRLESRDAREFAKRLESRWAVPFGLLRMLLTITAEFGSLTVERLSTAEAHTELTAVQSRLHARACQVSLEVVTLLQSGFADGAMARWRTLHEIAVVMMLLSDGGDTLAESYRLHEAVESSRAAHEYNRYAKQLGLEPFGPDEIAEFDQRCAALVARFGPAFREPYGWASSHLQMERPTFAALEHAVSVDHLRPYYRLGSHGVHANAKGCFFRLGLIGESDLILAGATNYGFADPGHSTAISLVHTNVALAMSALTFDGLVLMKLVMQLSEEVGESLLSAQREIEAGEIALRDGIS